MGRTKKDCICGIYKITNPKGKIYIGQSKCIHRRLEVYKYSRCKGQLKIYNSIKKYGWDTHTFEVIEECEFENLNFRERYWQEFYNVLGSMGLNLALVKTDEKPRQLSEESIQKIRVANTGRPNKYKGLKRSKEECENIRMGSIGKKLSEAHKQKISDKNSGILSHLFGKFGEAHHCYGRKHSEETKEKIRSAATGVNSSQAKKVINTETGVIYNTVAEASIVFNLSSLSLSRRLRGVVKNDTPLKFLNNNQ